MAIEAWARHPTSQTHQVATQWMREMPVARILHGDAIWTLAYSPDGTNRATGSGTAQLFDAASGKEISMVEHLGQVSTLASPSPRL